MPAPLDLTGRRFGRLRVLAANGRVKFGREQTAWLVVCNCGRQETLAQSLLTQRGWRECSWCQRPECVICGNKVPSDRPRSNTCSDACASKQRRRTNLEHYHRRAADPEFNRRRHHRLLERMVRDTELAERVRQMQRESIDILPALKDGDSHRWTLMPERENVPGRVDITVVSDTALTAGPFSYTQPIDAFWPR